MIFSNNKYLFFVLSIEELFISCTESKSAIQSQELIPQF